MATYSVTTSASDDQRIQRAFGTLLGNPNGQPASVFQIEQQIATYLSFSTVGQEQVAASQLAANAPPLTIAPADPKP